MRASEQERGSTRTQQDTLCHVSNLGQTGPQFPWISFVFCQIVSLPLNGMETTIHTWLGWLNMSCLFPQRSQTARLHGRMQVPSLSNVSVRAGTMSSALHLVYSFHRGFDMYSQVPVMKPERLAPVPVLTSPLPDSRSVPHAAPLSSTTPFKVSIWMMQGLCLCAGHVCLVLFLPLVLPSSKWYCLQARRGRLFLASRLAGPLCNGCCAGLLAGP